MEIVGFRCDHCGEVWAEDRAQVFKMNRLDEPTMPVGWIEVRISPADLNVQPEGGTFCGNNCAVRFLES